MVATNIEVERTYELSGDLADPFPDLGDLPGASVQVVPERRHLEATYYDTPDLRLAARGITLRYRTGGADAGWHLKTPTARPDGRTESRMPAEGAVPAPFLDRIRAYTRGVAPVPVATITTERTARRLIDPSGTALAELVVDDVTARDLGAAATAPATIAWRELEVELLAGDRKLLKRVDARLRELGVRRSRVAVKLARVLGDRLAAVRREPPPATADDAGAVVRAYLCEQVDKLLATDPLVREDAPDAVHRMRVTTRRLRGALRTFAPVVGREQASALGAELKWLGRVLAPARDLEVLEARLRDHVRRTPPELALGPVAARLTRRFGPERADARRRLLTELDSPRYFALLESLEALVAATPRTEPARRPARRTLRPLVKREHRRVERRMAWARGAAPDYRDVAHHSARKAAKRARYAAEATGRLYGRDARKYAKRMHAVQNILGDRQDSVVTRERLRELAVQADAAHENAFTYGLFHNAESTRATQAEAHLPRTWHRATKKKRLTWLK
ncbi:MAG TPA: CYTH and CHAD domain-containing protein [Streptosporangiaceae bacterium]|jgi:CHAD domain-containing protein